MYADENPHQIAIVVIYSFYNKYYRKCLTSYQLINKIKHILCKMVKHLVLLAM